MNSSNANSPENRPMAARLIEALLILVDIFQAGPMPFSHWGPL